MSYYQSCLYDLKFGPVIEYEMMITNMTMLIVISWMINDDIYEWLMSFYQNRPFGMKFNLDIGNDILITKMVRLTGSSYIITGFCKSHLTWNIFLKQVSNTIRRSEGRPLMPSG